MTKEAPVKILNKREKLQATHAVTKADGSVTYSIQQYQKSSGSHNNSGPSGHRWNRFYPERAWTWQLGKHGLSKLRAKLGLPV